MNRVVRVFAICSERIIEAAARVMFMVIQRVFFAVRSMVFAVSRAMQADEDRTSR